MKSMFLCFVDYLTTFRELQQHHYYDRDGQKTADEESPILAVCNTVNSNNKLLMRAVFIHDTEIVF